MDAAEKTEKYPEQPQLPGSSCRFMKSDASMKGRHDFCKEAADSSITSEKSDLPASSCVSMKSDASMKGRPDFNKEDADRDPHDCSESTEMDANAIFKLVEVCGTLIWQRELRKYKRMLFPHLSQSSESENQDKDRLTTEDKQEDSSASEGALKITLHVLKDIGQRELANQLEK
eukprot:superscaffoldBa00002237_g13620